MSEDYKEYKIKIEAARTNTQRVFNRLAKWRAIFTSWQLGSRLLSDPESQAVRDHREVTILMRAEINALLSLMLDKGVFTEMEWLETLRVTADDLASLYEKKFPGAKAEDDGMHIDLKRANEWMSKFPP